MENREALTIFRVIQKCRHQALHTNDCGNCERCQYRLEQEQIDGAVALAISALENNKWIPVTERLPKENGTYLACYEDATVLLDWFNDKWFFYRTNPAVEETGTIIAWRPLPEPYTEEEA